jgi:uncharacterized protein (TIGR02246 family)
VCAKLDIGFDYICTAGDKLKSASNWTVLLATLALAPSFVRAQDSIPKWLQEENRKWYSALNAGNASALAKLYARDAVVISPNRTLQGRAAIEEFQRASFAKAQPRCTWVLGGAHVLEKQVALWGTDECTETPKSGGAPWTSRTRWLTLYERQSDGAWLVVRESYDVLKD